MTPRLVVVPHGVALLVISLLAACAGTTPTHYHTLLDAAAQTSAATAPAALLIDVQAVAIPAQVDRPQLVVRDGSDILPLEQERWIAPLADEVRAALSADLSHQLGVADVAGQPHSAGAKVLNIKIDLHRFESAPGDYAAIDSVWSLSFGESASTPLLCATSVRESAGEGYDELVRGHRRALAAIASRIASAARAYAAGKGACPAN